MVWPTDQCGKFYTCLFWMVLIAQGVFAQPLSGSYTVGGNNPDFASLQNAADALAANGVDGPVTFNLRAGIYQENGGANRVLNIPVAISGVAGNRIVTFRADAASGADSSNVILRRTSGPSEDGWLVHIDGGHITLDNLTFDYADNDTSLTGITSRRTVNFSSARGIPNDSITVSNCRFLSNSTSRPGYAFFISAVGTQVTVVNCYVEKTANGIVIWGGSYNNVLIRNNTLRRLHSATTGHAIYVSGGQDATIANNDIDYAGGYSGHTGIHVNGGMLTVSGNRIRNLPYSNTFAYTGIWIQKQPTGRALVYNNMVSNIQRSCTGIYVNGNDVDLYHNTVVISPQGYFTSQTALVLSSSNNADVRNNILMTRGGGFRNTALQIAGTPDNLTLDYNLLYSEPFNVLYQNITYSSLEDWQDVGFDANSQSFLTEFVSDTPYVDVHLGYCSPGDARLLGTAITEVTSDFDGEPRHSQTPYMGADESSQQPAELFSPPAFIPTNDEALYITHGDLDNDGDIDIAVVNNHVQNGGSGDVSLFWNDGSGSFSGLNHIAMGTQPVVVKAYDIDQDGFTDLIATTNHAPVIRWGTGGGNFSAPADLPDPGIYGRVDDFEYIVTSTQPPLGRLVQTHFGTVGVDSGWVSVCLYRNNRTFRYDFLLAYGEPFRAGMNPSDLVIADINNDGLQDVVVNDWLTGVTTSFIDLGNPAGGGTWLGFGKLQELRVNSGSSVIHPNIAAGDVDSDGTVDVLLGEWSTVGGADSLIFLRNNGSGEFTVDRLPLDSSRPSTTFSLFDYEGDGDQDIITATGQNDLVLYMNNGLGQFDVVRGCQSSGFNSFAQGIMTGLFSNDNSPDVAIVTGDDNLVTFENLLFSPPVTNYTYPRIGLDLTIPDLTPVGDTLNLGGESALPANEYIVDLQVVIDSLYHGRDGDLEITLKHAGIVDTLVFRAGGSGQNFFGTRLIDAATISISNGNAPFTGSYKPFRPLSQFHGLNPDGQWILEVFDSETGVTGRLEGWQLQLTLGNPTGIDDSRPEISKSFHLRQNYPNPFNPRTNVEFGIGNSEWVQLKVYDLLGREIRTLVNNRKEAGSHVIVWDGRDNSGNPVASGMYFYRLQVRDYAEVRKMLLVR